MNIYKIGWIIHLFWLVLAYKLLNKRIDDFTINDILLLHLLYKTNRLRVAVGLMWREHLTHSSEPYVLLPFSYRPHVDVISDLSLNRSAATWNPFDEWIIGEIVEYLITCLWIIGTIDLLKPEIYLLITSRTEFSKPPSLIVWNIKKAYLSIELPGALSKSVLDWITEHLQKPAEPF